MITYLISLANRSSAISPRLDISSAWGLTLLTCGGAFTIPAIFRLERDEDELAVLNNRAKSQSPIVQQGKMALR